MIDEKTTVNDLWPERRDIILELSDLLNKHDFIVIPRQQWEWMNKELKRLGNRDV